MKKILSLLAFVNAKQILDGGVIDLDDNDDFDKEINKDSLSMVAFIAQWCGYSKKLFPEYEKAAETLKDREGFNLYRVDAEANPDLAKRFEISSYPSIKWFKKGRFAGNYLHMREASAIVPWFEMKNWD